MDKKLQLWQKGEPITASKLNSGVEAINELLSSLKIKGAVKVSSTQTTSQTLPFTDASTPVHFNDPGVELYGYICCAGGLALRPEYEFNKKYTYAKMQSGTLACWPIITKEHIYCGPCNEYVYNKTTGALKLHAFRAPECNNAWQLGFMGSGQIVNHVYVNYPSCSGCPSCGCGTTGGNVRVEALACTSNWTKVTPYCDGNTTVYSLETQPRVLRPLSTNGDGFIGVNIRELHQCLDDYYPVICEHPCEEARIPLNSYRCSTGKMVYQPALPQWVMDAKYTIDNVKNYKFDPNWFCVDSCNNVTINLTTLMSYIGVSCC